MEEMMKRKREKREKERREQGEKIDNKAPAQ